MDNDSERLPLILHASFTNQSGMASRFSVQVHGRDERGYPLIRTVSAGLVEAGFAGSIRVALTRFASVDSLVLTPRVEERFDTDVVVGDDLVCPACGTLVCSCKQRAEQPDPEREKGGGCSKPWSQGLVQTPGYAILGGPMGSPVGSRPRS